MKYFKKILISLLIYLIIFIILLPVMLMLINSFMGENELYTNSYPNYHILPESLTIINYHSLLTEHKRFYDTFLNSMYISISTMLISIVITSLASYGISRLKTKMKGILLFLFLFISMLPTMAMMIPLFLQFNKIGLYDTRVAVILVYTAYILPFTIWIMKAFFDSIPVSLEEAALIDGCNRLQVLYKIVLPLSLPGIGAIGIFSFIQGWGEFLIGSILSQTKAQPFTVWVANFVTSERVEFGKLLAAGVISIVPIVLLALLFQRLIIKGLLEGAVKG